MTEYVLMNKNTPVLNFEYSLEDHRATKINELYDLRYAPLGILDKKEGTNKQLLNSWWSNRAIPASRVHLQSLLMDLRIDSTLELAEKSFGLSLSDRYWINDVKNPQEWSKINFFDNDFSDDLGLLTLGESSSHSPSLMSPNSTLGGNLNKKWKCINGERVLIKTGMFLGRQEIYNEVIAANLFGRLLGKDEYVPYYFLEENGRLYSACNNMLHEDEELIPAWDVINTKKKPNEMNDFQFLVSRYQSLGLPDVEKTLTTMFVCDYILSNADRHWNNFGVIRNVETLEYTRIAPIFDTGYSLWCWEDDLTPNSTYTAKPFNTYGMTPEKQLQLFTDFSWFDKGKLQDFSEELKATLSKSPVLTSNRIDLIASRVDQNIQTVLSKKQNLEQTLEQTATHKTTDKPKRPSPAELAASAKAEAKRFNEGLGNNTSKPSHGAR